MNFGSCGIVKQPDFSLVLSGREGCKWPVLVIESNHGPSGAHPVDMARLWIKASEGQVKVVIVTSVHKESKSSRPLPRIDKWVPEFSSQTQCTGFGDCFSASGSHSHCVRAVLEQRELILGTEDGNIKLLEGSLNIEFEELFLRAPSSDTGRKIVLSLQALDLLGTEEVWAELIK
ncbi:uncharacterized protein BDV14DRAFT_135323 [Aspergillus stella-maris]|uniref:uncharacterized protein n=1 Tax=Aspergillus stella-maris TaxID=1810926 RepID=UPI003CCD8268